jgi:hypothetical protein
MSQIEIGSFFTLDGEPATHLGSGIYLDFPKLRIYEITSNSQILIVNDSKMINVGDGFYSFAFTSELGYNATKHYRCRMDGGSSVSDQYQIATIDPEDASQNIGDQVWDTVPSNSVLGSAGQLLHQLHAMTSGITISLTDINDLISLCIKYQTNRTRIDIANKTLTVYDGDGATPLRTFKLLNSQGIPSTDDVAERVPIYASDNFPVN